MSLFRFGPGPAEAWGAEGAIRLPLQIFLGIEKRTHEEREIFFYFAPQIFEPSAGSVCCCAISTYYVLLHLDTRLDLNLRSGIHKVIAKRLPLINS